MPQTQRTNRTTTPRKPGPIRIEPTLKCMKLIGALIRFTRRSRESLTKPSLGYLTRAELARMATLHLDKGEPPISGSTIKALEEQPSTRRAWRLVAVVRALGYSAVLRPIDEPER